MPKNNKKGKQKEVPTAAFARPAAPPPAPAPPPPPSHPPLMMTIDTIEEEDDGYGEPDNMEEDNPQEDSWEQMHEDGDDLNGWATQELQNSNGGWAHDDGWGTSASEPQAQIPQPPPKDEGHMKSQKKQHFQQQYPQHHQQLQEQLQHRQHQPLQTDTGWGTGGGAWDNAAGKGAPAPAKHQNVKRSQTTQRAMEAPAWSGWGHEVGWGQGGHIEEIEEEEWSSAEDDPWGQAPMGWPQQKPAQPPQAHAQHQPVQQGSWQTWGEEARRLPKSQQPYHAASLPPGTGGYFHPQGANKQWSQQQASMAATFRQQQEQAYALAQAQAKQQHQHQKQQYPQQQHQQQPHQQQYQQYPQQQHQHQQQPHQQQYQQHQHQQQQHQHQHPSQNQFQQEQADNLVQAQHRDAQLQEQAYTLAPSLGSHQQPHQHQPQHEEKKNKKNKENKHHHQGKKEKKHQQQHQENDAWGLGEGWQDLQDSEEDEEHDGWDRRVHFSPARTAPSAVPSMVVENFTVNAFPPNKLGLSTYGTPAKSSKTLAYAYHGTAAALNSGPTRNYMQDFADTKIVESHGAALAPVEGALFGRNLRMAKDRFHWMFSPDKDPRVASLLAWISDKRVSYALGSLGLYKFLQTRERGALLVNVEYQSPDSPEPAFDWLTYPDLQKTKDRTLQESVAFYDPSVRVIVFVILPSKSGNSLAMWRRKIDVPSNVRLAYQAQVTQVIATLNRDYVVHVDEIPQTPSAPPPPKKKRKWWKLWLSS